MTKNYDQTWEAGGTQPTRIKHNRGATTDPGATNDTTEGYEAGSTWWNLTGGRTWRCMVATEDAAVWLLLSGAPVVSGHSVPAALQVEGSVVYMPDHYDEHYYWNEAAGLWLSVNEHEVHWPLGAVSTDSRFWFSTNWSDHYGIFVTRAHFEGRTGVTNDGSNYWTMSVVYDDGSDVEATLADSTSDTSTRGTEVWFSRTAYPSDTPGTAVISDSYIAACIDIAATGSPAPVDPCTAHVAFRYVGYDPA